MLPAEVRREAQGAVVEGSSPADQGDAAGGEGAEVDGVAAVRAANRDGDMLRAQRRSLSVPQAQDPEPPAEVAPAVPSRGPLVRADGQEHAPPRLPELGGDLHSRRSGPDHQDVAVGQLPRVAVGAGVDLRQSRVVGNDRRDDGSLERPGRDDDEACVDGPVRRLGAEAGLALRSSARMSPRHRTGSARRSSPRRRRSNPRPAPSTRRHRDPGRGTPDRESGRARQARSRPGSPTALSAIARRCGAAPRRGAARRSRSGAHSSPARPGLRRQREPRSLGSTSQPPLLKANRPVR